MPVFFFSIESFLQGFFLMKKFPYELVFLLVYSCSTIEVVLSGMSLRFSYFQDISEHLLESLQPSTRCATRGIEVPLAAPGPQAVETFS